MTPKKDFWSRKPKQESSKIQYGVIHKPRGHELGSDPLIAKCN